MDLKGNRITVAELLSCEGARDILNRHFGRWMKSPVVQSAGTLTLQQVLDLTRGYVPRKKVESAMAELKSL